MKKILSITILCLCIGQLQANSFCDSCSLSKSFSPTFKNDYQIVAASVTHNKKWGHLEFQITVKGKAGRSISKAAGKMNGAPVDGYVFPTSLSSEDVGFSKTTGIVALALTAHADFDDTPLWDEDGDGDYSNDKIIWHPHWVILVKDNRVGGGLSVKEFAPSDKSIILPKTNPGMPMYMDSPGFHIVTEGSYIRVIVPDYRVRFKTNFKFDAVGAYMQLSTAEDGKHGTDNKMPMLGVYKVFSVLSGKLTLPYSVKQNWWKT